MGGKFELFVISNSLSVRHNLEPSKYVIFQRFDIHTVMISEGHGIMNKTTRESALGIKLKIVEIEEFGGLSHTNVKDLVEYLKEIRNLSEVSYLYIVYFVFKFQRSFKFSKISRMSFIFIFLFDYFVLSVSKFSFG